MTAGQSDLMRGSLGLVPDFKKAGLDNAKIVVPFESAGLLGAAQTLRSVLAAAPTDGVEP